MNQPSQIIATLIDYAAVVGDTLEYCLRKPSYDVNAFQARQKKILDEVDNPYAIKQFIDQHGEEGAELEKAIREFHEEVYGENSTILKLAGSELRVDHAQHNVIYKHVLPIYANIDGIIRVFVNSAHKDGLDVSEVESVWKAQSRFYTGFGLLATVADLSTLFDEYNKARNEAKGENTPASNFIGQDINTVLGHIGFVRRSAKETDLVYKRVEDQVNVLCENVTGRRDLLPGQRFPEAIRDTNQQVSDFVRESERPFRESYAKTMNELVAAIREEQAKNAAAEETRAA